MFHLLLDLPPPLPPLLFLGDGVDGPPLDYEDTGLTIIDRNTGLEFEKKVAGDGECVLGSHGVEVTCTFEDATSQWIEALNAVAFAGHTDWRLTNVRELMSIVDYNQRSPAIDSIFDPTASAFCWSSASFAGFPGTAWVVSFGLGIVGFAFKFLTFRVRGVRGGR